MTTRMVAEMAGTGNSNAAVRRISEGSGLDVDRHSAQAVSPIDLADRVIEALAADA